MEATPTTRRWFQVRLSTVFVLTAIAAGGMATWPWIRRHHHSGELICGPTIFQLANPLALLPALALFAFVAWKAAPYALAVYARNETMFAIGFGMASTWIVVATLIILIRTFAY